MKTVITKITIKTEVINEKDLADENIERYRGNVYETIRSNVDDNAKIEIDIDVV